MQYEYDNLFKELLEWQSRRIALLTTAFTVVIGVLTFGQAVGDRVPWWAISFVLLLFLTVSCHLTAYAGYANQRLGAFFETFHDPDSSLKWELRSRAFNSLPKKDQHPPNLNRILYSFYLLLGLISVVLPPLMFTGSLAQPIELILESFFLHYLFVVLATAFFGHGLWKLKGSQALKERLRLLDEWEQVRLRELASASSSLTDAELGSEDIANQRTAEGSTVCPDSK